MRKTSHDGGDSTSITSGVENEMKKCAMKPKKSSLKRKVPSFSQESDDTVIEPLLQRDKEKSEAQSAKIFGKGKTDSLQAKESDNNAKTTATTGFCGTTESLLSFKDSESTKTTSGGVAPIHNYMNSNVFNTHDNAKVNVTAKTQILVEIDSCKHSSYTPSPLIFTTAKIHTDTKIEQMEPVHVTPVPILSTIEVSMSKRGNITSNEKKISNSSSVINPVYSPMPLSSKDKDEKISSISKVVSPTTNKDTLGKMATVTSVTIFANITEAQSNSMKITLPSTISNSSLMKSNIKDKQGDIIDVKKEQMLPYNVQLLSKDLNLEDTKNNGTVKAMTPSLGEKVINYSTTSTKISHDDKPKVELGGKASTNVSSYDPLHFTSNINTPISKTSVVTSDPVKTTSRSVGSKQLQRQKTTTEDISNIESKAEPNMEHSENSSAKISSSSHAKISDNISSKDGVLPNICANNTQSINFKSPTIKTANSISKITPMSTTTKSSLTNTVTTSTDFSSKPTTATTMINTGKTVSPTTIAKTLSNENEISTASAVNFNSITKPSEEIVTKTSIPKPIVTAKFPEVTSSKTQPQTAKTTSSVNSDKSKVPNTTMTTPSLPVGTIATTSTQPVTNSTSKTTVAKPPPVTISVKATLASSITKTDVKQSSSTNQVSSSKLPLSSVPSTAVTEPAVTTSISKTLPSTAASIATTSQNITAAQGIANKQAITAVGMSSTTKTPSVVTSGKSSAVNTGISASKPAGVKSPNNNSSQVYGASKPTTTSIPKTEPTLSKTIAGSSSANVNVASAVRSLPGTSTATINTKDSVSSVKKSAVTKIQPSTTKSPVNSSNKSIAGTNTKVISSDVSSVPMSAFKKPSPNNTMKTGIVKTPSVSTSPKTPDTTSISTTFAAAIKPPTKSTTQVSVNKSVGIAGSSVPSFTPVLRPSESIKKGGLKSSENNKDGKVS